MLFYAPFIYGMYFSPLFVSMYVCYTDSKVETRENYTLYILEDDIVGLLVVLFSHFVRRSLSVVLVLCSVTLIV